MAKQMGMHVVLVGSLGDGFTIYGPFKTGPDAAVWANKNVYDREWWVAPLQAPDVEE